MARLIDTILGHKDNVSAFLSAFEGDRLPNTFLFVGANGIGKKTVAVALAQCLLCETSTRACGKCPSCLRVAKHQHESLRIIQPDKGQIKIEQSRDLLHFLSLRSLTARRAVIIDEAEKLNPQAANSLLKILEEPNPNTFFFLIAPSSQHVLPTLRSRAQIFTFHPLNPDLLRQAVPAPEWAIRAAQGSFNRLKSFQDSDELEVRRAAIEVLKSWNEDPQGYLRPDLREYFRDRSMALTLVKHLGLMLRDAVAWQIDGVNNLFNPDQVELFSRLGKKNLPDLLFAGQQLFKMERELAQNRDSQLLFEEFWIQCRPSC